MKQDSKELNALLCQVHSIINKKEDNMQRFSPLLLTYTEHDNIDIVVFPQMSFTGYNFKDQNDAQPQSVFFGQGMQFDFCSSLAKRLKSYVLLGYIEKVIQQGKTILFNSAAIINREGVPVFNTRKTHLYFADELWCQQGDGFKTFELVNTKNQTLKCAIGICMDINEKHFNSKKNEFADFIKETGSEVILFPTNWIDGSTEEDNEEQYVIYMYQYWLQRLNPIIGKNRKNILFLAADRVGKQYSHYDKRQFHFLGSSCALSINPAVLIDKLDKKSEKVLNISYKFK